MNNKGLIINLKTLIIEVLKFERPTDKILSYYFKNNTKIGSQDRHIIAETIYAILRNYFKLKNLINKKNYDTLILYIWQNILQLDNTYISNLNKNINLDSSELNNDIEAKLELPMWLIENLKKYYSIDDLSKIAQSFNQVAPLDLRINILKTNLKDVTKHLDDSNIKYELTKISPYGIRLYDKNFIIKNKLFANGLFEVQDESSQIAAILLNPKRGDMVVDFCAGSGGKTLAIGMIMRNTGRIYAFDINEKRLNNLSPRLQKSALSNIYPFLINHENDSKIKRLYNKIDKVLVDAPCSGIGTLRRNPDLKFRQSLESIANLNKQQLSILNSASKLLKINGILAYATCSIIPEENQLIIEEFLQTNSNFEQLDYKDLIKNDLLNSDTKYLQLLPHIHSTDGFFIALLKRVK
jgi:16S rRNA (cytosine967-C5)-methyltransferase